MMNLRQFFAFTLALFPVLGLFAQSTLDSTGGRFLLPVFDSVQVVRNVPYMQAPAFTGLNQSLEMDVFFPFENQSSPRPLLVLVHGGGFLQGNRTDMEPYCRYFARCGYTTATIQYRLGFSGFTPEAAVQTVIRATQDLKCAVRFLRNGVSQGNPFGIDPDWVFCGGASAGAITVLHAAYLTTLPEANALPGPDFPSLDSLDRAGFLPGVDWRFKAAINLAGALGDTNWIQAGDVPLFSAHGTADLVVPYEQGSLAGILTLFGSRLLHHRAMNQGIHSELRPFPGAGHDFTAGNPSAVDTTQNRIARFLFRILFPQTTRIRPFSNANRSLFWVRSGESWRARGLEKGSRMAVYDLKGRSLGVWENDVEGGEISIPFSAGPALGRYSSPRGESQSQILP